MNEQAELREDDAWIAEHVFGWRRVSSLIEIVEGTFAVHHGEGVVYVHVEGHHIARFCPTSGGSAAMQVLEKCVEVCGQGEVRLLLGSHPLVKFGIYTTGDAGNCWHAAETLPLAIVRFAKALFSKPLEGGK